MFVVEETARTMILNVNITGMSEKEQGDQCGRVG